MGFCCSGVVLEVVESVGVGDCNYDWHCDQGLTPLVEIGRVYQMCCMLEGCQGWPLLGGVRCGRPLEFRI